MSHKLPPCDHDECPPSRCLKAGSLAPASGSLPRKRKPTKGDLIALLTYAAHEAGSALSTYHDDRQPDRAGQMEKRLRSLQKKMHEAAGHFPPPRRSPWTEEENTTVSNPARSGHESKS